MTRRIAHLIEEQKIRSQIFNPINPDAEVKRTLEDPSKIELPIFDTEEVLPKNLLTGENDRPSTGRVEPVRGCLNNPSRLVWTTLTSLTAPLAALRSRKETKEKVDLS
jgi:hypothetical protein